MESKREFPNISKNYTIKFKFFTDNSEAMKMILSSDSPDSEDLNDQT